MKRGNICYYTDLRAQRDRDPTQCTDYQFVSQYCFPAICNRRDAEDIFCLGETVFNVSALVPIQFILTIVNMLKNVLS
jgi:hypothetical protein